MPKFPMPPFGATEAAVAVAAVTSEVTEVVAGAAVAGATLEPVPEDTTLP